MPRYSNVNGVMREVTPKVNVNGLWKDVDKGYSNVNGLWLPDFSNDTTFNIAPIYDSYARMYYQGDDDDMTARYLQPLSQSKPDSNYSLFNWAHDSIVEGRMYCSVQRYPKTHAIGLAFNSPQNFNLSGKKISVDVTVHSYNKYLGQMFNINYLTLGLHKYSGSMNNQGTERKVDISGIYDVGKTCTVSYPIGEYLPNITANSVWMLHFAFEYAVRWDPEEFSTYLTLSNFRLYTDEFPNGVHLIF